MDLLTEENVCYFFLDITTLNSLLKLNTHLCNQVRLILHILLLPLVNRYVLSLQLIVDQGLKFNPLRVLFILIFVELGFDFFEKLFTDFALKLWLVEIDQDLPINFKEAREIELEVVFCEDFDEFSVLLTLALKEGLQFEKATLKGIIFFKLG